MPSEQSEGPHTRIRVHQLVLRRARLSLSLGSVATRPGRPPPPPSPSGARDGQVARKPFLSHARKRVPPLGRQTRTMWLATHRSATPETQLCRQRYAWSRRNTSLQTCPLRESKAIAQPNSQGETSARMREARRRQRRKHKWTTKSVVPDGGRNALKRSCGNERGR